MTTPTPAEQTFFEEGEIKITDSRAVFGPKTYALKNITSVEMKKQAASGCGPSLVAVLGAVGLFYSFINFHENWYWLIIGLALLGLGYYLSRLQKAAYIVKITGSSGETNAFSSTDQSRIQRIVSAINNAIIAR